MKEGHPRRTMLGPRPHRQWRWEGVHSQLDHELQRTPDLVDNALGDVRLREDPGDGLAKPGEV